MDISETFNQLLGYFQAQRLDQLFFSEVIPPALIIIMFGMGLSLEIADLKRIVKFPKAVAVGLSGQLILLPMLAFLLVALFKPSPAVAVGAIILAACPGGVTSNAYVFTARADLALSVVLTAAASLVTVFTIPLLTIFALDTFMAGAGNVRLDFWLTVWTLAKLTIIPVGAGMTARMIWPAAAVRAVEVFRKISLALLIAIIIAAIIGAAEDFRKNLAQAGAIAVALNLAAMSMGYLLARVFKLSRIQSVTITFEVGVQNLALAALVTLAVLQRPDLFVFTAIYSLVMKMTAFSLLAASGRLMAKNQQPSAQKKERTGNLPPPR